MDLLGMLSGLLTSSSSIDALSAKAGTDGNQTKGILSAALPMLLGALTNNASSESGAASLFSALMQHTNTDSMEKQIADADAQDGEKIISHILGSNQKSVLQSIAEKTGADPKQISTLLSNMAPGMMSGISAATSAAAKTAKVQAAAAKTQAAAAMTQAAAATAQAEKAKLQSAAAKVQNNAAKVQSAAAKVQANAAKAQAANAKVQSAAAQAQSAAAKAQETTEKVQEAAAQPAGMDLSGMLGLFGLGGESKGESGGGLGSLLGGLFGGGSGSDKESDAANPLLGALKNILK